ncbi:hypothetical protein AALP_AA5G227100 [Arabis alpina]|uniref:MATH domain-containing protein n=1 Tax=Arabis alpina TaxID=50452 RepID=A0A087GYU3_ARAAL|nr:hypothetical protein AALP_AA5G227100 [Arabis alpina]
MGNESNKKFTWVIKNFSSLQAEKIYSDEFVIGGCKWHLKAFPKGNNSSNHLSLYLVVADAKHLSFGWKRHAKLSLTVVNQISEKLSLLIEIKEFWLDEKIPDWGLARVIDIGKLKSKNGGFLVNGEVKIVVEVDVLEVIGELDVPEATPADWVDVNGFQVLRSQAKSVKRIFERHPDMALEFRAKNQHFRTTCMNLLLNLINTLCQSLQDLSIDDLGQAEDTLTYLKKLGFEVDWLEHKLEEVKEKKIEEEIGEIRMQELEKELKDIEALMEKNKEELKDLEKKCLDTKALLKKEKAKVLAARAPPLTLDDVV